MLSRSRSAGFTLLEVLVAFMIAALAFTMMFKAAGGGLASVSTAGRYEEAISRARSHLAAVGSAAPISPGILSGNDGGGYRWRIAVDPVASTKPVAEEPGVNHPSPPEPIALYRVTVTISWSEAGRQRQLSLQSQRIEQLDQGPQ